MHSEPLGVGTLKVEVTNISTHGIWLLGRRALAGALLLTRLGYRPRSAHDRTTRTVLSENREAFPQVGLRFANQICGLQAVPP